MNMLKIAAYANGGLEVASSRLSNHNFFHVAVPYL
jgi:hypothetical protein